MKYTVTEFARLVNKTHGRVSRVKSAGRLILAEKEPNEREAKILDCPYNRAIFHGEPGRPPKNKKPAN